MIRTAFGFLLMMCAVFAHAEEIHWPQELTADNGAVIVIYQPQIETFSGNSLEGRAAVSVKSEETGGAPVFGAIWFQAKIDTDRDTRSALIRDVDVADVRFADATDAQKESLAKFIEGRIEGSAFPISVDQVLTDLDTAGGADAELKHDAPEIMLSTVPALLVSIDGEPRLEKIDGSKYERVVNTPFLIVKDGSDYYLYIGSDAWYEANAIAGPWAETGRVPQDIRSLVEPAEDDDAKTDGLRIIIATTPTELVVSDGPPSWTPVEGMGLLYMDNTDSNAFLELSTQRYYVLLSGRWYRSEGMEGELTWMHVPNDQLPEPFADIPEDSVNGAVLSQVAGTQQAREAVLDNTIPQTAAIQRDDDSFTVEYDGKPDFAPIENIQVQYAQNTSESVFKYGKDYFACNDGVWYQSASATGPWKVATEVPQAIYDIPASNPHHNVTYVKVYDVTPQVVYVGYTPGYYGSYYYRGTVIYGTGWYYNPWYGRYYYPRYPTWGFHVHYNPWYGWGFGVSWTNGPFRFTFSSRGAWWGVGGYRPYPRPVPYGGYRKTNININNTININGRPNRPQTRPNLYNRPQNLKRNAQRPAVPADRRARPANNLQNNVLTDRSGNVYQRDNNGSWKQRDNGQWKPPQNLDRSAPSTRPSQLPSSRPSQLPSSRPSQMPSSRPSQMPSSRPSQFPSSRPAQPAVRPQLERDFGARQQGMRRSQGFQRQGGGGRRR
ncbi:MAG: carbohydrate-binding family V/XII [Pseudomonadota bacterium]